MSGSVVVHCGKLGDRGRRYRLARSGQVVVGRVQQDVGFVVQGDLDLQIAVVLVHPPAALWVEGGVPIPRTPVGVALAVDVVPVDPRVHVDGVLLLIGQVGGVGVDPLVFGHRIGAWRAQEVRLPDISESVVVHCGKLGDRWRGHRLARRGQVVVGRVQQDVGLVVQGDLDLQVAVVLGDVPAA